MAEAASLGWKNSLKYVEWMWKSNAHPWSKSEPQEWSHYSDVENLIIEEAFIDKQSRAMLDNYYIDFEHCIQVSYTEPPRRRPVKRIERKREDKHLREARFVDLPVGSGRSCAEQYGWIAPFVVEVRTNLGLKKEDLPSKKPNLIPMLVEKAARGIVEEGKHLKKQREGEKLAKMLREKKYSPMKEVWKCCVYLYSLESFLYKTLNAAMRLVGDEDHENVWRSKIQTLGPFCLLLWDDPINVKGREDGELYRGAELTPEQIDVYVKMVNKWKGGSFQAFSSCSRNRQKAEEFGNSLFIMKIKGAFIADLSQLSEYPNEEEELITPGVYFQVTQVKFDRKRKKHYIYLVLEQEHGGK